MQHAPLVRENEPIRAAVVAARTSTCRALHVGEGRRNGVTTPAGRSARAIGPARSGVRCSDALVTVGTGARHGRAIVRGTPTTVGRQTSEAYGGVAASDRMLVTRLRRHVTALASDRLGRGRLRMRAMRAGGWPRIVSRSVTGAAAPASVPEIDLPIHMKHGFMQRCACRIRFAMAARARADIVIRWRRRMAVVARHRRLAPRRGWPCPTSRVTALEAPLRRRVVFHCRSRQGVVEPHLDVPVRMNTAESSRGRMAGRAG